jgi:hypothetical protein
MNREDYMLATAALEKRSTFTVRVMDKLSAPTPSSQLSWRRRHTLVFGLLAALIVSLVGFTGYSYATGSNPVELIRRIVSGDSVKVEYQGRTFTHGKNRTYSDAAITAQAEINLTEEARFYASTVLSVPKNGIEYVDDPTVAGPDIHIYPKIAYAMRAGETITIHEVYIRGDKMTPSADMDKTYTVSVDSLWYFDQLKESPLPENTEILVALYQNYVRRHVIGEKKTTPLLASFAFKLTHPLQDYLEADKPIRTLATDDSTKWTDDNQVLLEENFGGQSKICMNNGADECPDDTIARGPETGSKSLYFSEYTTTSFNPNCTVMQEMYAGPDGNYSGSNYVMRWVQGKIVGLDATYITIKTSSKAIWKLYYPESSRQNYQKHHNTPLKIGDSLQTIVYQGLDELDSRTVPDKNIMSTIIH